MTEADFYDMAPVNFAAKVEGYNEKLHRERNDLRMVAFLSLLPHTDPKKHLTLDKFSREWWPLPGDEVAEAVKIDPVVPEDVWSKMNESRKKIMQNVRRSKSTGKAGSAGK